MRRALLALLLAGAPLEAQQTVVSPGPDASSVTVYRNPERNGDDEMNLDWLAGFALITETRTIALPAGESVIRFEGVAGQILPVSAIVSGLPGGVIEKNRDARLLSPAALIDGSLGRRVHIRRTSRATGKVSEGEAVIRAGPDGGVVLQTAAGIEALGCAGLPEMPVYDGVPAGMSDKPTLSVTTHAAAPASATVTLSYLAGGFDWQANYVAQIAPGGRALDLFSWLTLANGNGESFPDARVQAVAGTLNREEDEPQPEGMAPQLDLQCWPMGTTSDGPFEPPAPPPPYDADVGDDIIVTGARRQETLMASPVAVITAGQEELGDLKLYRIPEPVTVAAHAQKQVALLARQQVPFERVYGASVAVRDVQDPTPAQILLRMKNVKDKGLGLPLPAGSVAVFEPAGGRPMLAGETAMEDKAIGQDVEWLVGESPQIQVSQRLLTEEADDLPDDAPRIYRIEITNANPAPVRVELLLRFYGDRWRLTKPSRKLGMKDGRKMWAARVPANGSAALTYTLRLLPDKIEEDEDDE